MVYAYNIKRTLITCLICYGITAPVVNAETQLDHHFTKFAQQKTTFMDFSIVNNLLYAGVLDMGRSSRSYAKKARPATGTRLRQPVDSATENESNRFFYENLAAEQEKILTLRQELENIPTETPLHLYTKEQQLAYWLNLYNVTVINEIAKIYPIAEFKTLLADENSFFSQKLLEVDGIKLSLNDIHFNIIPALYPNEPLVLYGLYQGYKGSPSIRQKAFTGENVFKALKDNAEEFINSNRGTQFNGDSSEIRVSAFFKRNAMFFPDFQKDLKQHLLKFADKYTQANIEGRDTLVANVKNYRTADIYGTYRKHEGSVASDPTNQKTNKSYAQLIKLRELMRVRAVNMGGGTVTVTDLDSESN